MWGHPQGNGRKLIYSDFAQVELRIIWFNFKSEMNMYKSLKEGIVYIHLLEMSLNLSQSDLDKFLQRY